MIDELGVYYVPGLGESRAQSRRSALVWRIVWGVVAVIVFGLGIWLAARDQFASYLPWLVAVFAFYTVVFALYDLWAWRRAEGDAQRARQPLALGLNRDGVLFQQQWFGWGEVAAMAVTARRFGGGPKLSLAARDGRKAWLPLGLTDMMPATLDSIVRALSAGRVGVDLSRLEA
ncbi:MAG: hypothetical protein LBR32_04505 [Propionibacteriaceae bacterium]|jgi:hypothetical protein|nr:hypothetical protein [Propionibacteriaceae bacterium]